MTDVLHNKEFSRKSFLKGGGALVVGFSLAGAGLAGKAQADAINLVGPLDQTQVDSWIVMNSDNTVTILMGKVEFGQGTATGTRQIVAEELDLPVTSVRVPIFDTGGPHPATIQGPTVGSSGIKNGGPQFRTAAAEARRALLALASAQFGVPVTSLTVTDGVVSGGGRSARYSELLAGKLFNTKITGTAPLKPVSSYKVVTTRVPRFDIPDKVSGKHTFVHNIKVPNMLHGRVVRPRGQAEYVPGSSAVLSINERSINGIPGARVVRRGDFVAVVAPTEYAAIQAAARLEVKWADLKSLPGNGNLYASLRKTPTTDRVVVDTGNIGPAFASAAKVVSATYEFPFQNHGVIGPSCAVANVTPTYATVFCQFQGGYERLRPEISRATGLPEAQVRLLNYEGASTFGHNGSDSAAVDAAIVSQLVGKPVRLQWMRWDEHGWDNYGPPMVIDIRGGLDAKGKIVAYEVTNWAQPAVGTIQAPGLEAVGIPIPFASYGLGGSNASTTGAQYAPNIPNRRQTGKALPSLLRAGTLQGPGFSQPGWASEQMIDELAYAANMDPVAFRLAHQTDPRWLAVLNAVTQAANWQPKVAASNLSDANIVTGRGIALVSENIWTAAVADIEVNKTTGKIVVKHLYGSQENGLTVNPGLVENQMVGQLIRGASKTIHEQLAFTKSRVTGLDWVTYPILRFKDHPNVTTALLQRVDLPYDGAGESLVVPVPPAIANAFFDATGVRMRTAPLTPARVRAALKAAGK